MSTDLKYFELLDGTSIPWLAWGTGTGGAKKEALRYGLQAIKTGIRHIDTAQFYHTEDAVGEVVATSPVDKKSIYVTSKLSTSDKNDPIPLDQVQEAVAGSVKRLGFVPDLFLIHNPFVATPGDLKATWNLLEDLKAEGKLNSIGVSNFRVQDFETILDGARYKPVVNQIEYHPYVLAHLEPVLQLQAKLGILTESYGALTPILRHPTGGPLKPILERISAKLTKSTGKNIDPAAVLLLWTRAQGVVAVTASGNNERIQGLADVSKLPDLLSQEEIDEITRVGKTIHFRYYTEHMEKDFLLPDLPSE